MNAEELGNLQVTEETNVCPWQIVRLFDILFDLPGLGFVIKIANQFIQLFLCFLHWDFPSIP